MIALIVAIFKWNVVILRMILTFGEAFNGARGSQDDRPPGMIVIT